MGGRVLIFDRLVLDVADLDRASGFYVDTLDFQRLTNAEWLGHRTVLLQLGAFFLHLLEEPKSENPLHLPKSGPVMTLADNRIEERYEALRRVRAEILAPLRESPWGGRSFLVRDPDGYVIVIQEPRSAE